MIQDQHFFALKTADGSPSGLRLHYAVCGDASKPVMLFLHGFPQAWFVWEVLMEHFSKDYFCVAPDLRGFNLSSKPTGAKNYSAKALVDDVVQLARYLSPNNPITLVAHDWGGAIAWNVVVQQAALVRKFVAINSPHPVPFARDMVAGGPQASASSYMDWLAQSGSEAVLAQNHFALLEGFFTGMGQGGAAWFTPAVRARYHAMWSQADTQTPQQDHPLTGCVNYYRATPLTPAKVAQQTLVLNPLDWQVRVPTRVVWGAMDIALPLSLLDGLEGCVPDLSIRCVPHGNHWLIDAYPQDVMAAMVDFV